MNEEKDKKLLYVEFQYRSTGERSQIKFKYEDGTVEYHYYTFMQFVSMMSRNKELFVINRKQPYTGSAKKIYTKFGLRRFIDTCDKKQLMSLAKKFESVNDEALNTPYHNTIREMQKHIVNRILKDNQSK